MRTCSSSNRKLMATSESSIRQLPSLPPTPLKTASTSLAPASRKCCASNTFRGLEIDK